MSERFYCPQPVLSLRVEKRKDESEAVWGRRFEQWQKKFGRLMALRVRLEDSRPPPP